MASEIIQPIDRPTKLLETVLGNEKFVRTLITSDQRQVDQLCDVIFEQQRTFDNEEIVNLVGSLLDGISREDAKWTQDRRSAALTILDTVDLGKVPKEQLLEIYLSKVASQNSDNDPFGTISDLLVAGKILAPHLFPGPDTMTRIAREWGKISGLFEGNASSHINEEMLYVIAMVPRLHDENVVGNSIRLGGRERPDFERREQVLHDSYMETVRNQKNFKLTLWESTPQYRQRCEGFGIKLENFWNLNDPENVVRSLGVLKQEADPVLGFAIDRQLQRRAGLRPDEITVEHGRVIADEIVLSVMDAYRELSGGAGNFDSTVSRLKELLEVAQDMPARFKKRIIRDAVNFFSEYGISVEPETGAIWDIFADKGKMDQLGQSFNRKRQVKIDAAGKLARIFDLQNKQTAFFLSSRNREDMFLGDLTGDCTAYHLIVGMNAWTVPVWLSNPGFNFYKITNQGELVAKLGLLMAVSRDKPVLVVDSFETAKNIEDEEKAKDSIREGLLYLKNWAGHVGFEKVLINTFSNSSDLGEVLSPLTRQSYDKDLSVFAGLNGVSELRQNLLGQPAEDERIYLQTRGGFFDFDDGGDRDAERDEALRDFEKIISETILLSAGEEARVLQHLSENNNWEELYKYIMKYKFPKLSVVIGDRWEECKLLLAKIKMDEFGSVWRDPIAGSGPTTDLVENVIAERLARIGRDSDDDIYSDEIELYEEAADFDDFLESLKFMEIRGIKPEGGLEYLYGEVSAKKDTEKRLMLDKRIPELII